MFADDGHAEVVTAAAAKLLGERPAQEARAIGAPAHLREELLPLLARRSVRIPVGACVLSSVVEVLAVRVLERSNFLLNEGVERTQRGLDVLRDRKIHGCLRACGP